MIKHIFLIVLTVILSGCTVKNSTGKVVKNRTYELHTAQSLKAVLVLFPCYPCDIEHTKTEAAFLKDIEKEGISVLLLSYNQKLFLTETEKKEYAAALETIFDRNKLSKQNIFIGGFSSGGNVALLLSAYLIKNNSSVQPKGTFVVDSPIDIEKLYHNAEKDIAANADPEAVAEGKFLVELFDRELGKPDEHPENYKQASPYLMSVNSTENIQYLKGIRTRFYCEPDLQWQNENRGRTFENLNAFMLTRAHQSLIDLGSTTSEYIETQNRGIRGNGKKHPHSWNIVERESLVKWMLEK
ncbi:MAG: hypothetical protein LBE92_02790 [Chryseobacterium sp.]|jgi:hypothetical protein|uniref:hypothetical protein n=1 Tax=Chryseobacterium sp. TaxID=1871047 RepID=UPI0028368B54|nr:hypothetical protein [Chryseobacterium sp.]MDR2235025.1 hypothetical protein [Chryseobacterium sp.]